MLVVLEGCFIVVLVMEALVVVVAMVVGCQRQHRAGHLHSCHQKLRT